MNHREQLIERMEKGEAFDFLFFWGHTPKDAAVVDKACFSQWFPRAFDVDGVRYPTAEHFMMAEKARLFRDEEMLAEILASKTPADAKALGRKVKGYDDEAWRRARLDAVVRGNIAKFAAHEDLKAFLLSTGERILVEASPRDRIWGIGMGASNPDALDPKKWRGQNLLGFALVRARSALRR